MLIIKRRLGEWIAIEDAQGNVLEICICRLVDHGNSRAVELGFRSATRSFRISRGRSAGPQPSPKDEPMPLKSAISFISAAITAIQNNPALMLFLTNEIQALLKQYAAAPATTAHTFQARAPRNLPPEPFTPDTVAAWAHANMNQP